MTDGVKKAIADLMRTVQQFREAIIAAKLLNMAVIRPTLIGDLFEQFPAAVA